MTQQNQIYKCSVCGNIVEVLHTGQGELVCCGKPMELLVEKTEDQGMEKHMPVMEILSANVCQGSDGTKVKVGSIPHPMEQEHYIEWVEIKTSDGQRNKKFLKPGDSPEAAFDTRADIVLMREHCNVHGLWKKQI